MDNDPSHEHASTASMSPATLYTTSFHQEATAQRHHTGGSSSSSTELGGNTQPSSPSQEQHFGNFKSETLQNPKVLHGVTAGKQPENKQQPLKNGASLGIPAQDNIDKKSDTFGGKQHHQYRPRQASHDLEPSATHISRRYSPDNMLIQKDAEKHGKKKSGSIRTLPLLGKLPLSVKNHLVAVVAEFAGTFMFLLFAFGGTQVVNGPAGGASATPGDIKYAPNDAAKLLYISLSFGMSLMVTAWVFFRISGGLFNPAVTLGLALVGVVSPVRAVLVAASQLVGGIAAAAVVDGLTPGDLNVNTRLLESNADAVGMSLPRGVFMEMFMTAQLVFTVFMLAAEKHRATFIAPVGIGLSLFIGELMSVYYTGGSLNPARSFGPSVIEGFDNDHWIYWVGPILGALIASGFYALAKAIKYETVNPGQDEAGEADLPPSSMAGAAWGPAPERNHASRAQEGLREDGGHQDDLKTVDEKHFGGSVPTSSGSGGDATITGRGGSYSQGPALEAGHA